MKHEQDSVAEDCKKILEAVDLRSLKNKRVLVTGANGLIGQYVVSALHAANQTYKLNCHIVCVSLHGPGDVVGSYLPNKNIVFKKIDLAKPFKLTEKFDYIFHAAGYGQPSKFAADPVSTIAINIDATRVLLEAAEKSKGTVVLFSSAEVYGEMPRGMAAFKETFGGTVSAPDGPRAVYAGAKRLGEALGLFYAKQRGVRVKIVRISAVYGPGASTTDARVMSDFIRKALTKGEISLMDQGKSVRTYGYLADVVAMILFAATKGSSTIYNVGGRDVMSIRQLAEQVASLCGAKVTVPKTVSRAYFVGRDPNFVKLDLSKIKKEMKSLTFTPFKKGLKNTIAWAQNT